jgi:glycosyltransferase involved in cell wall biosynthesis
VPDDGRSRQTRRLLEDVEVIKVSRRTSRLGRLALLPFSVLVAAIRQHGDIYHFHDPELLPIGFILRFWGRRVIYDAHEDLPRDILIKPWIPRPLRWLVSHFLEIVEWVAGRTMSGIIAATPVIAKRFPEGRTALVQNFARAAEFESRRTEPPSGLPIIAYVGSISIERCAMEMVRVMGKLSYRPPPRLALVGPMPSAELHASLTALPGWRHVDFRGLLDRDGVGAVLGQASIGLALFHPLKSYMDSQPVKFFEYMAAGIPVITSDFPRFRELIEAGGCGLCVSSCDTDAIAAAIDYLLANPQVAQAMGDRGKELVWSSYSWKSEEHALLRLYERVAPRAWSAVGGDL